MCYMQMPLPRVEMILNQSWTQRIYMETTNDGTFGGDYRRGYRTILILTVSAILDSMYGCNHLREGKVATGGASQVGLYASRKCAERAGRIGVSLHV